jgi:hypothetical protein
MSPDAEHERSERTPCWVPLIGTTVYSLDGEPIGYLPWRLDQHPTRDLDFKILIEAVCALRTE